MCGITGWIDWNKNLKEERPTLEAGIDSFCKGKRPAGDD